MEQPGDPHAQPDSETAASRDHSGDAIRVGQHLHVHEFPVGGELHLGHTLRRHGGLPGRSGESGNASAAAKVKTTSGAIGYISGSYLLSAGIATAQIRNAAGRFEYPNPNAIEAAAATVRHVPSGGISIINPPKSQRTAYPISGFSYAIVPRRPIGNVSALKAWLTFCVTIGRTFGFTIDFVRIPAVVQAAARADIAKIS